MAKKTVGLFIGRFQPFHKGHLDVIKKMFKAVDIVIIGIGSMNEYGTVNNPYTYNERFNMINNSIAQRFSYCGYEIKGIPDIKDDQQWIDNVINLVGKVDVVYTGNELVKSLFEKCNIKVKTLKRVLLISGSDIRQRIAEGGRCEVTHLIPKEVFEIIR